MRTAMVGIIATVGMVCSAAWRPGMAGNAALAPHPVPVRSGDTETMPQADRASAELLAAAEAALWERLQERGRPEELKAFLTLFPHSRFAAEVHRRHDELATDARQQGRTEEVRPPPPSGQERVPSELPAAAAGAAAVSPECGLLAAATDETSITVAGVLRRGQERMVQGMLDAFGVPAKAVRLRLDPFEGPYCGVLSTVRMYAGVPPPDAPPRIALLGARPLPEGERLRFWVEMPDWPAHLNVFFLTVSDEVGSLVADPQPRPVGASVLFEDPRWKVAAPFGTELLLVVASETPLFERRRPAVEKLEDFAAALTAALQRARRATARVAARATVVETAAR